MEDLSNTYLEAEFEKELGAKLAVIEELRSVLNKQGIECPGVLVVGSQSSGKSSVLERLTGISFPRGENTCTRFPTIVQLQTDSKISSEKAFVSTCADFSDAFTCSASKDIQKAILSCTEKVRSKELPIADVPIHVRYIRRSGPVMTLIDLPGITHVDAKNESFDIHAVTAGMVETYVNNENMVVLVVIPANDDFGNSEALKIAQTFDRNGNRTIGVVSKCDLVPDSSDVVEKIRMTRDSDVKLALGFIAVRNRGPNEETLDIKMKEKELFSTHKVLKTLMPDEWGYTTLSKRIVQLQSSLVNHFIPEVQSEIRNRIFSAEAQLRELGFVPSSPSEMRSLLTSALAALDRALQPLIRAESSNFDLNIASKTTVFAENFAKTIRQGVPDFLGKEYRDRIYQKLKKSTGYSLPNFIGDTVFREEIRTIFFHRNVPNAVEVLITDTAELMDYVFKTAIGNIHMLNSFPSLARSIVEECHSILHNAKERTVQLVSTVVHSEESQVFTVNQDYIKHINQCRDTISQFQQNHAAQNQLDHLQRHHRITSGNGKTSFKLPKYDNLGASPTNSIEEFMASYKDIEDGGLLSQATLDLQISIQQYSNVLLKRLLDIISIVVRGTLVIDVVSAIHVKVQTALTDELLIQLLSEHDSMLREKTAIQNNIKDLKEAQNKLRLLK